LDSDIKIKIACPLCAAALAAQGRVHQLIFVDLHRFSTAYNAHCADTLIN